MLNLLKTPGRLTGALFAAGLIAAAQGPVARPGAVNYTEGQVTLDGQTLTAKSLGQTEVAPGQILQTQSGKAEMLLTPGVFLRLGGESSVKMVSPSLTDTRVELLKGEAVIEAAQIEKENHIDIIDNGFNTQLEKRGIYKFDATQPQVAVYDGQARVQDNNDHSIKVGKGKAVQLVASTAKLKAEKFDRDNTDALYSWSKLRSEYMAEANMATAQTIVVNNPGWWYGTGWYWNPYFDSWAFVPGGGFAYSPFGFGFYSPGYWSYYAPVFGGGYWNRGIGRRVPVTRGVPGRAFRSPAPAVRPGAHIGVPAARSFGGGFRGMGGGFHGAVGASHGGGRR